LKILKKKKVNHLDRFKEILDDFYTMESVVWDKINNLNLNEVLEIIRFYKSFGTKLDGMYPKSRPKSKNFCFLN